MGGVNLKWLKASNGEVPPGAVWSGYDKEPHYVGRVSYEGQIIPGKVGAIFKACYFSLNGKELGSSEYEVLCDDKIWVKTSGSNIPIGAIPSGHTEDGEVLYIGRAHHDGTLTLGKVLQSEGCLLIPYGRQELKYEEYEVLTMIP